MVSFKLAAIQILKESNEPLHYEEITRRALEKNLIETTGNTPEQTMSAQISTDIRIKKERSAFIKTGRGLYSLNAAVVKEEEAEEIAEEEVRQEEEKEKISTQYVGKGGEHRVVSELLFRGYNASIMSVDEGIDIVAVKDNQLFNIQVKTSNANKFNYYIFDVKNSSFERFNRNNTYYVFVLRSEETNFLVLPYMELQKSVDQKNVIHLEKYGKYRINIRMRDGKVYLGNKSNDVTYYQNNWSLVK